MIVERKILDGRPASVTYLDMQFKPVERSKSVMAKVCFDDGEQMFMVTEAESKEGEKSK